MEQLLSDVKNYLDITWQDEGTDRKLTGIIERGKSCLQNIAGSSNLDFIAEALPRSLLLDYCRYAWSGAAEMFETNFRSDLLKLRISQEVSGYAAETTGTA